MLQLYNSLTRKKEEFKPINPPEVGLYTCGPTVYDYDHIGHAWTYTTADLLRRTLEFNDYKVRQVMNITDVGHLTSDGDTGEDKLEKGARREGKTVWEVAKYYTDIFLKHRNDLNLLKPNVICKATDHIPEMIDLIKKLEAKGATYVITDGVYFDISKFPAYGKLSGNTLEKLKAGARIEVNPEKKNPADFALWKFSPADSKREMEWDSPWGKGFPGWHIECSAMSMKYLGESFDIHSGGEDNKFPHHECEIAQTETATGKTFVNYWFHTRFLMINGQKMSKSLKNFYTLDDVIKKGFSPLAMRYLCLTAHYRTNLNFTWKSLEAAQTALNNLYDAVGRMKIKKNDSKINCAKFDRQFTEAINDDINTPKAIAIMWELMKSQYPDSAKKQSLLIMDKIFGLGLDKIKKKKITIPPEIKKLAEQREKAREEKNWALADQLREKIEKEGFAVEDTDGKTKVKNK
ncbi:MAG: cysteine--tRNA ligase [bacterium]|nr:cysteine--tRNA ligase [bacterium]